jgi:TonB family protein
MNNAVLAMASYALNAAWQIPLLAAVGWLASRLLRHWGPQAQHRVWVATLMLSVLSPLLAVCHATLPSAAFLQRSAGASASFASLHAGGFPHSAVLQLPAWLIGTVLALYACSLLYFVARLIWLLAATRALVRTASLESWTPSTGEIWQCAHQAFARADAAVLASAHVRGAMTIGAFRPSILLPAGFLSQSNGQDLLAALGHELAHIERRDYAKNLFYEIAGLAVAFHPATWFAKTRIVATREMICDALVVDRLLDPKSYRESLLRLASRMVSTKPATAHAVGMFDANILEKRIMMMKTKRTDPGNLTRAGLAACVVVLMMTTMIAATAFARPVDTLATQNEPSGEVDKVGGDVIAPTVKTTVEARFPKSVNLPKGQSVVCLIGLIVSRDGMPQNVHVVRSAGKDFDASAMKAVQQYRFNPATRAGNPVSVKINIEVNFRKY